MAPPETNNFIKKYLSHHVSSKSYFKRGSKIRVEHTRVIIALAAQYPSTLSRENLCDLQQGRIRHPVGRIVNRKEC
jgi:hypothetical protein